MPSQKPRKTNQPSSLPADDFGEESVSLTPTLVVLWSRNSEATGSLRAEVTHRLAYYSEIGALQWAGPFSFEQGVTGRDLVQACKPLLSWDLWQHMVEKGHRPGLPEPGSPVQIQVILVMDRMTGELDGSPLGLMEEMQKLLKGQADLLPALIWLGEKPDPPPEDLNFFWPRIRMEPVAAGGIAVEPHLVWEVAEHLLVALVGSAFVPVANRMVQKEKAEWLVVGASALLLHPDLTKWLYESVLKEVLASLIAPLSETERDRIEGAMSQYAQKIREALREEVVVTLQEGGWNIQIEGPAVRQCILKDQALLEALFGPYVGIAPNKADVRGWRDGPKRLLTLISALAQPHLPDPKNLGKTLYRHYQQLNEQVEQWLSLDKWRGLAPRTLEEYQDLIIWLGAFLDRGLTSRFPSGMSWWFTERPLPTGLPATLMALLSLEKYLCEEGDFKDAREDVPGPHQDWVRPEPLNTEAYFQVAGETDAAIIRWNLLRYAHFARTLASPGGVLLYLLPAWPLATFLVQSLAQWESAPAVLATGLGLLAVGLAELAYWWLLKARRLLKTFQKEAHRYLGSRILRLAAGALRDYRHWMLTQLREAEFALTDLYSACRRRYAQLEKTSRVLGEIRPCVRGNTFFLVDIDEIQAWQQRVQAAVRNRSEWLGEDAEGRKFESAVTGLIVQAVWPLSEQPMPGERVLAELEKACAEAIRGQKPLPDRWSASVASEKTDGLKEGRRWEWLWHRAHPLGRIESPAAGFTFIIAPEEFVGGNTGRESVYWQSDWETVPTFQSQEEMCIRVSVEPKRGA